MVARDPVTAGLDARLPSVTESVIQRFVALGRPPALHRLATAGFWLVVLIFVGVRLADVYPWNDRIFDLWAYWWTRFGIDYTWAHPGQTGAYIYSPAFAQLIHPLTALPLPIFSALWTAMLALVLFWLTGWRAFFIGLVPAVAMSLAIGQTDLLMAAVIVLAFRWPASLAFLVITKLTPGIALLWFAARREWRSLALASVATLGVIWLSLLVDPRAWAGWIEMLTRFEFPTPENGQFLPVPLWIRLPLCALLIVWGARMNRRWVLPIGVCFSLPTVWLNTPTILVAILPLIALGADTPAGQWLRAPVTSPVLQVQRVRRRARRAGLAFMRELGAFTLR